MPIRALTPELTGPYYAQGLWRDETLCDLLDTHVRRTPGALAVADQHERLTYAEFAGRSAAFAGWLVSREIGPGSVLAIQTGNRVSLALAHFACSRADLVFVPLSTHWRRTEMESLLRRSGVSVLVLPPATEQTDFFATVNAMRGDLPQLRLVGGTDGLAADFDFDAVLKTGPAARPPVLPARPRHPDDPRFITITSGTTDTPKMSQWTDNNLSFLLRDYAAAVGMGPGDVAAAIAPANTGATGYLFPVLAPLLCGAGAVLLEDWGPAGALDLLEAERATHAAAIPTQLVRMLQDPRIGTRDFSAVRVITSAGRAADPGHRPADRGDVRLRGHHGVRQHRRRGHHRDQDHRPGRQAAHDRGTAHPGRRGRAARPAGRAGAGRRGGRGDLADPDQVVRVPERRRADRCHVP